MLSLTHAQLQSNQDSSDWDDKLLIKISKNYQYLFIKKHPYEAHALPLTWDRAKCFNCIF